jgi:type II secretory pathway component PulK
MRTRSSISHRRRRGQSGSAVVVVLVLLFIMVVFVTANTITLNSLRRQVKLVEQRQIQRLAQSVTNQPAVSK